MLHGQVISVGRNARSGNDAQHPQSAQQSKSSGQNAEDTDPSKQSTYIALVSLDQPWIETEQGVRELTPGMAVTAEIKTGRRRVISYLLSPLTRYRHEAARER